VCKSVLCVKASVCKHLKLEHCSDEMKGIEKKLDDICEEMR
jgi:hypothetical protein